MRRVMVGLVLGALVVGPAPTLAQEPMTMLCVAVVGSQPPGGWTAESLVADITTGSAEVALVAAPADCGGGQAPTSHTLTGSIALDSGWTTASSGECYGRGRRERLLAAEVTTLLGERLAWDGLNPGVVEGDRCVMTFDLEGIPLDLDEYVLVLYPDMNRVYTEAELDAVGWHVDVVYGEVAP